MNRLSAGRVLAVLLGTFSLVNSAQGAQSSEERSLNELRNTVVNLLQALVQKGVMTQEQAGALVQQAQTKAEQDAAAAAAEEAAEADAVRVTHVPDIVKLEIRNQVANEVKPQVVTEVLAAARNEKWGVPGALPDWVNKVRLIGDVRVRGQGDIFASANADNFYLDYNTVNARGGIGRAGIAALSNIAEDRQRLRLRARFGAEVTIADGVKAAIRASTGNFTDPVSTNQTLGNTGTRYQFGVEQAYIRWDLAGSRNYPWLTLQAGRTPNPWVSTDLLWDADLSFEGVSATYRLGLSSVNPRQRHVFFTLGGFPLQEIELSKEDKWLYGAQLGLEWTFSGGSRLRVAGALYDYENIVGQRNALDSTLYDFTAPQFLQRGNTLFDIRTDSDGSTNLYALAADYTIANLLASFELALTDNLRLTLTGDYVRNIGYDEKDVLARTRELVPARTEGYQGELAVGSTNVYRRGGWRAFMGYRYLERDAVLDAFTDSDFRGGGTDVKGYFLGGDLGLTNNVWLRMRYLSGSEIDGPPLGLDVWQLDVNTQF